MAEEETETTGQLNARITRLLLSLNLGGRHHSDLIREFLPRMAKKKLPPRFVDLTHEELKGFAEWLLETTRAQR